MLLNDLSELLTQEKKWVSLGTPLQTAVPSQGIPRGLDKSEAGLRGGGGVGQQSC